MTDVLVLNHDEGFDYVTRFQLKRGCTQRSDDWAIPNLQGEEIDIDVISAFQKVDRLAQLLVETVVERHCCIPGQPAVRSQRAVLGSIIVHADWLPLHVATLAGGEISRIESKRVAL